MLVTAAALSQLERPTPLRQLCFSSEYRAITVTKGSPATLSFLAGEV